VDASLVELVTELVLAELARSNEAPMAPPSAPQAGGEGRRLLLACAPASGKEPIWAALQTSGLNWTGVGQPCPAVKAKWVEAPRLWDEFVHGFEALVVPVLPLAVISRVALLLSDCPVSSSIVSAICQGVPVLACAHEVDALKRSSGRLPGPFLSLFHQHLRTLEGMGVQLLEQEALLARLGQRQAKAAPARGRDVITLEDLEAAMKAGQTYLQVLPGSIVTPLAREKATQMNIEIRFA
jgi:hypothetical protein